MRLIIICIFVSIFLNCGSEEQSTLFESVNFELVELSEGVYSCIHKIGGKAICNVGIVDTGVETLIFDSFLSPDVAQELLGILEKMDLSPLKYVVNSHCHNDHIRGNQVFPKEVKVISTARTIELISNNEPLDIADEQNYAPARFAYFDSLYHAYDGDQNARDYKQILMWRPYYEILSRSHLEIQTRLPDTVVDSILNLDGPKRRVELITKGPGHTESDLVLYLPDDKILFSGDLIFNKCHPYVAHGNIDLWKAWLDYLISMNINQIMPGHGALGSKELIPQMKTYLVDLEMTAKSMLETDAVPNVSNQPVPEPYKDWWFDQFYPVNLGFAYEHFMQAK